MSINARIATVWKDLSPRIRVASAWKTPDSAHIRVGGVWKQIWSNIVVQLPASDAYYDGSLSPADSYAGVQYTSAGDVYKCEGNTLTYVDTNYNWLLSGSASSYWIKCTYTGDAPNGGSTTGVWHQLSTTRSWSVGVTANTGLLASNLTIQIASDSAGVNVLATGLVYIEANVEI